MIYGRGKGAFRGFKWKIRLPKKDQEGGKQEDVTYSSDKERGGKDAKENEKRTKRKQDGQVNTNEQRRLNANYKYTIERD